MFVLMLDPRFKSLSIVKDFVGRDNVVRIVGEYDEDNLIPLLIASYRHLNPRTFLDSDAETIDFESQDLFGIGVSATEIVLEVVKRELSFFRQLNISIDECSDPLQWWKKNESKFPTVGFLARQMLEIIRSEIKTKRIFSIAGVLTALRCCQLQFDNLNKLVLVFKNWPNDPRKDCNSKFGYEAFKEIKAPNNRGV